MPQTFVKRSSMLSTMMLKRFSSPFARLTSLTLFVTVVLSLSEVANAISSASADLRVPREASLVQLMVRATLYVIRGV